MLKNMSSACVLLPEQVLFQSMHWSGKPLARPGILGPSIVAVILDELHCGDPSSHWRAKLGVEDALVAEVMVPGRLEV